MHQNIQKRTRHKRKTYNPYLIISSCLLLSLVFFIASIFLTPNKKRKNTVLIPIQETQKIIPQHPSTKTRKNRFLNITSENRAPRIPVLLYHDIQETAASDPYTIKKQKFEEQLLFLKNNGYTTITMDEFIDAYHGKINLPKKSVLLTFDNGYVSLKTTVNPLLIKHKLNAIAFVIGQHTANPDKYLSAKDIYNIQIDRQFDIESKSSNLYNNETKTNIVPSVNTSDFINDNKKLENIIGHKIHSFSYPNGEFNTLAVNNLKSADIQFGFGLTTGKADWIEFNETKISPYGDIQNPLILPRISIKSDISIAQFEKIVTDELS